MMKKILVILMFSLGVVNALAATSGSNGCLSLVSTTWKGSLAYNDNSSAPVSITIQTVTQKPNQKIYSLTGIVNGVPFSGAFCWSLPNDKNAINGIGIGNNTSRFVFSNFNNVYDPSIMNIQSGQVANKIVIGGRVNKQ